MPRNYVPLAKIGALIWSLLVLAFLRCSNTSEQIVLKKVASGLKNPVFLTAPQNETGSFFIVEKVGRIWVYRNGKRLPRPFLDISRKVYTPFALGEMGMLGLAFHPQYGSNGYLYVSYNNRRHNTIIERYSVLHGSDFADASSSKLILKISRHSIHHHGGMLLFGADGMLYIGVGDGSTNSDYPKGNAQNKGTLLGDLLRIDVDNGDPYSIPRNNPYYGHAKWRHEIWASGLRNPWRFSIDFATQFLYIGDTGEKLSEEIDVVPVASRGLNFGWKIMEGTQCFTTATTRVGVERYKPALSCDSTGLTLPVMEYSHLEGCAVIGGYVYRGNELASIEGHYFYADYCLGWIRSFRYNGERAMDRKQWDFGVAGNVLSFGEDAQHNLYVLYEQGDVYKFAVR